MGDTSADGEDATAERESDMGLPNLGGGDYGGFHAGGGYLPHQSLDHCCIIYCNKVHYGPVSGSGAVPRGTGAEAVVGTG